MDSNVVWKNDWLAAISSSRRYLAENYHEASPSEFSSKTKAERDRDNPMLPILRLYFSLRFHRERREIINLILCSGWSQWLKK